MGKIPSAAIIGVALVLIIGISAGAHFKLIKPKLAELAQLQAELEKETQKAAQLEPTKQELARVTAEWMALQVELAKLRKERGIPCSLSHPLPALLASLWPELQEDLPEAFEQWMEEQDVTMTSGFSLPAPPSTPPSAQAAPEGFMPVANFSLGVQGSLSDIERFYRGLGTFPRIATISGLSLAGAGDRISATVPMAVYLLVEVPPTTAVAETVPVEDEMMEAFGGSPEPGADIEEEL